MNKHGVMYPSTNIHKNSPIQNLENTNVSPTRFNKNKLQTTSKIF
jgi:hypothetical protein